MRNCVDIVRPFVAEAGDTGDIQIVGGVGSFALQNSAAEFLPDEQTVILPDSVDLSGIGQFREDGNRRDFDVLVKSTSDEQLAAVEALAEDTIGDELIISVFGLHDMSQLRKQQAHPGLSLAKVWVADRYVTQDRDGKITEAKKSLFPFAVDMDPSSLENWHLIIGKDAPMPIPHPGTVLLNYLTRSISGLRPKDHDKVNELGRNIFTKAPEIIDWIVDGPGATQLELARILHGLRSTWDDRVLMIGEKLKIESRNPSNVSTHPAMMIKDSSSLATMAGSVSRAKARGLHFFENQGWIVTAYQRHVESHLGFIVSNR